jgi:hypothetical protein
MNRTGIHPLFRTHLVSEIILSEVSNEEKAVYAGV